MPLSSENPPKLATTPTEVAPETTGTHPKDATQTHVGAPTENPLRKAGEDKPDFDPEPTGTHPEDVTPTHVGVPAENPLTALKNETGQPPLTRGSFSKNAKE